MPGSDVTPSGVTPSVNRRPTGTRRRDFLMLASGASLTLATPAAAAAPATRGAAGGGSPHWTNTWASMPQLTEPGNLPPAPFTQEAVVFADTTLRQTVRATIGGRHLRLRFSNAFGGADLPITGVRVALPSDGRSGVAAIQAGTSLPVTFQGRPSTVVPVGAQVVSDPVAMEVAPRTILTVTTYLATGQATTAITSHPGSRTTSHLILGDHLDAVELPGATAVDHWYLLSGVEVWAGGAARAAAILGDSLTDGRGSTTNGNDRWPDQLLDRLHGDSRTDDVAIINQAAGGNRVLHDGLGPNALARLDRDVLAQSGVTWLVVFEGINDIGTAEATEAAQQSVAEQLIAAYDQIIVRTHAQGIWVYGATLLPFGGNTGYDDATGLREAARQTVNDWIRTSGRFDAIVDFDAAVRDPAQPRLLRAEFDTGDHLHLNPAGYRALAEAVPARLFIARPLPSGFGFR